MRAAVPLPSVPLLIVVGTAVQAPNDADRSRATRLHEDAKAFATANPDKGKEALDRYKDAEDEICKLFERAHTARQEEAKKFFEEQYRGIQAEGDSLCATVFTPDVIARTPWKDLLAPDMVKDWVASSVQGFSWRIERGTLQVEGPAKGTGRKGILSIGTGRGGATSSSSSRSPSNRARSSSSSGSGSTRTGGP